MNISAINSINFGFSHSNETNMNNSNYRRLLRKYNVNNDSFDKKMPKSNKPYYLNEQQPKKSKSDIKAKLNLDKEEVSDVTPKFSLNEEEIKTQIKEYEKEIFELQESLSSSKNPQEYNTRWQRIIYLEAEIKKLKGLL